MALRTLRPARPWALAAGGGLFLLTAVLVARGALQGVDGYAVAHWMPWLRPRVHTPLSAASLLSPEPRGPAGAKLLDLWIYPAAVVPSAVIVAAASVRLRRAGATRAAVTWCVLWAAANAIELAGKALVARPALYATVGGVRVHVTGFDQALPSGHTLRALVLAGAVASAWRRGWLGYVWAATVPFALLAIGWHTPTDIAAALFAGLALYAWAPPPARARRPPPTAPGRE